MDPWSCWTDLWWDVQPFDISRDARARRVDELDELMDVGAGLQSDCLEYFGLTERGPVPGYEGTRCKLSFGCHDVVFPSFVAVDILLEC